MSWRTPTSVYSKCGEDLWFEAARTIDNSVTTTWVHSTEHTHWIAYDMGSAYKMNKLRIYTTPNMSYGVCQVCEVYISDDPVSWGSNLLSACESLSAGTGWKEVSFTATEGRYIKIVFKTFDLFESPQCNYGHNLNIFYEFDAYCVSAVRSHGYIFG